MKDLIDRILKYLPQYLLDFSAFLSGPKRFVAARDMKSKKIFVDALLFLGISIILFVIMTAPLLPPGRDLWSYLAGQAVISLVVVCSSAVLIRLAWWLVGGQAPTKSLVIVLGYLSGVTIVVVGFFQLICMGLFKLLDPKHYLMFMNVLEKGTPAPDLWKSSVVWITIGVYSGIFLVFSFVLLVITWGAFRKLNRLSRTRSAIALTLYIIFSVLFLPISLLIAAGVTR